jgi:hypothetical protein
LADSGTTPPSDRDEDPLDRPPQAGVAGASARREYELRKGRREQRLREKWGPLGGLAVALSPERQTTTAWERGAVGEERLGARLDSLVSANLAVLHDRRIPGTKANIDHLVVTRHGVWAIDAKRYSGRPSLKVEGGIMRPRVERLLVGQRDCTKLVDGVLKQVHVVRQAVPGVLVRGAICFVDADWPLIGGSFITRDVHVLWPKKLTQSVVDEPAGDVDVSNLYRLLAARFPSA